MSDIALKSSMFGLWLQINGANTPPLFLGCHELGDLSVPQSGSTPVRCRTADGKGWRTVQQLLAPPDNPGTNIQTLQFAQRDLIEKISKCSANLFILGTDCGDRSLFSSYQRGEIMHNIRVTSKTFGGMQMREEDVSATVAVDIISDEVLDVDELTFTPHVTTEVLAFNSIWVSPDEACGGNCGVQVVAGDLQLMVADGGAGKAKAYMSVDGGANWTALATEPGAVGKHLMGVTAVQIDATTKRFLIALEASAGAQGTVYLTDDNGATYVTATLGGAAAGHGVTKGTGFYGKVKDFCFAASALGFIYKSIDGGETWVAKESGAIHVGDYACINFADDTYGIAGGEADIIALSDDGGETWYEAGDDTSTGDDILCCARLDRNRLWVGTDSGKLFYSQDGGDTWEQRGGWVGSGVGKVMDILFLNELVGFMLAQTAGPVGSVYRTIDGGNTWEKQNAITGNTGLNKLAAIAQDYVMLCGEPNVGPLGVYAKGVATNQP